MTRIFMSAGEPSGVNIAVPLMRLLRERLGDVEFAGLGGPAMVDCGMQLIYDPAQTATMWLWGNLKRIPAHKRALQECIADWERRRPDVVITVDYQAFHLYLGAAARKRGIPVVHYVSSQFWGRRYWTLEPLRRAYDHVLCIHEFEKPYYDAAGIPATFVGHPLLERLQARTLDAALVERLRARPGPRLGLLAGSRGGEIRGNLPVMLDAAKRLDPVPSIVVSCGKTESRGYVDEAVAESGLDATVLDFSSGEILSAVDLAFITSGSASMEAVYYGCPCCIVYRLGKVSFFFAKPHVATDIGQPNLVAGERIVPEFLAHGPSGRDLAATAQRLLDQPADRDRMRERFAEIRARVLQGAPPTERAADVVERILAERKSAT